MGRRGQFGGPLPRRRQPFRQARPLALGTLRFGASRGNGLFELDDPGAQFAALRRQAHPVRSLLLGAREFGAERRQLLIAIGHGPRPRRHLVVLRREHRQQPLGLRPRRRQFGPSRAVRRGTGRPRFVERRAQGGHLGRIGGPCRLELSERVLEVLGNGRKARHLVARGVALGLGAIARHGEALDVLLERRQPIVTALELGAGHVGLLLPAVTFGRQGLAVARVCGAGVVEGAAGRLELALHRREVLRELVAIGAGLRRVRVAPAQLVEGVGDAVLRLGKLHRNRTRLFGAALEAPGERRPFGTQVVGLSLQLGKGGLALAEGGGMRDLDVARPLAGALGVLAERHAFLGEAQPLARLLLKARRQRREFGLQGGPRFGPGDVGLARRRLGLSQGRNLLVTHRQRLRSLGEFGAQGGFSHRQSLGLQAQRRRLTLPGVGSIALPGTFRLEGRAQRVDFRQRPGPRALGLRDGAPEFLGHRRQPLRLGARALRLGRCGVARDGDPAQLAVQIGDTRATLPNLRLQALGTLAPRVAVLLGGCAVLLVQCQASRQGILAGLHLRRQRVDPFEQARPFGGQRFDLGVRLLEARLEVPEPFGRGGAFGFQLGEGVRGTCLARFGDALVARPFRVGSQQPFLHHQGLGPQLAEVRVATALRVLQRLRQTVALAGQCVLGRRHGADGLLHPRQVVLRLDEVLLELAHLCDEFGRRLRDGRPARCVTGCGRRRESGGLAGIARLGTGPRRRAHAVRRRADPRRPNRSGGIAQATRAHPQGLAEGLQHGIGERAAAGREQQHDADWLLIEVQRDRRHAQTAGAEGGDGFGHEGVLMRRLDHADAAVAQPTQRNVPRAHRPATERRHRGRTQTPLGQHDQLVPPPLVPEYDDGLDPQRFAEQPDGLDGKGPARQALTEQVDEPVPQPGQRGWRRVSGRFRPPGALGSTGTHAYVALHPSRTRRLLRAPRPAARGVPAPNGARATPNRNRLGARPASAHIENQAS